MTQPVDGVPDVSVIIPVYNCGPYLAASMASILGQTLASIEIIAVDDGSTDGSGEVLDALAAKDDRLRVVHQPNGGIVSALNAALALARGRYIARMDGDDLARADRLELQRRFLEAHPDHVAVGSLYRIIDSEGAHVHSQRPSDQSRQTDLMIFPPFVKTVPHPTLMVRTEAIRALGGYRSFFPHAEDHDLFLRLAPLGKIAVLPELLLDYRVHASASSARHRDTQLDSVLKAQCAAMILARSGEDVFRDGDPVSIEAMVAGRANVPPLAAWSALRALRNVEYELDRRDPPAARKALARLAGQLLSDARALQRSGALAGLFKRGFRCALRLAYISARG